MSWICFTSLSVVFACMWLTLWLIVCPCWLSLTICPSPPSVPVHCYSIHSTVLYLQVCSSCHQCCWLWCFWWHKPMCRKTTIHNFHCWSSTLFCIKTVKMTGSFIKVHNLCFHLVRHKQFLHPIFTIYLLSKAKFQEDTIKSIKPNGKVVI